MQKFTKGLVQITDLLEPPPLYNGLWGGVVPRNFLDPPPPPRNPLYKGGWFQQIQVIPTNPLGITLFAN